MSEYFTWDISREIFTIYGPMALRWYSLLFITGLLVGNYVFIRAEIPSDYHAIYRWIIASYLLEEI